MHDFIDLLTTEFQAQGNSKIALQQKAYMRNQFIFFGLKTPVRRAIQKPFLVKSYLPEKSVLVNLVKELWQKGERDFQLFAQELVLKYIEQFEKKDIQLLEFMITTKSW